MKMLLVPKMTACYALSSCTVAIDNSLEHPRGCPDNYYSRAWTFQEFCLPPSLLVFKPKALQDSAHDSEMRKNIQCGSWLGGGDQKGQEFHNFLVVGTDSDDDVRQRLLDNPSLLSDYSSMCRERVAYVSSDRFPAILQVSPSSRLPYLLLSHPF
jgi:hypothetical protein